MRLLRYAFGRVTPALQPSYVYAAQVAIGALFETDDVAPDDEDNDDTVPTINGPVRVRDIPRGADGRIAYEWLVDNCPCPDHELARLTRGEAA